MAFDGVFSGRSVLVTGHTGFKGSWLTSWLLRLGARVSGFALDPTTTPSLFYLLRDRLAVADYRGDVRDAARVHDVVRLAEPDVIFHLAAQPIVRRSYDRPLETLEVNALGTAAVLEAVRQLGKPCVVLVVTSDKCYENREWVWGYREGDPLGGHDPYSASKAAAELVVQSWRRSFFPPSRLRQHGVRLASARAGNVIGGGDWSPDRLVPDCIRALTRDEVIRVRNPQYRRPWQHVLEPLSGYLWLAARLLRDDDPMLCDAWNFGPSSEAVRSVADVVTKIIQAWGSGQWQDASEETAHSEAQQLALCCDKALSHLSWWPTWSLDTALEETVRWYRAWAVGDDLWDLCRWQIKRYTVAAEDRNLAWARSPCTWPTV